MPTPKHPQLTTSEMPRNPPTHPTPFISFAALLMSISSWSQITLKTPPTPTHNHCSPTRLPSAIDGDTRRGNFLIPGMALRQPPGGNAGMALHPPDRWHGTPSALMNVGMALRRPAAFASTIGGTRPFPLRARSLISHTSTQSLVVPDFHTQHKWATLDCGR